MKPEVEIYDTTLRDGSQGEGINFSVADKLRVAERIDARHEHWIGRAECWRLAIDDSLTPARAEIHSVWLIRNSRHRKVGNFREFHNRWTYQIMPRQSRIH